MRPKSVFKTWATGCLGLSIGWGFYYLAIPAGIGIIIVLVTLKKLERYWIENKHIMKIDIQYNKEYSYSDILIKNYNIFKEMNVRIKDVTKSIEENKISYTLIVAKQPVAQIEAAVVNPPIIPLSLIIVPAPKKPIPLTT